MGTAVLIIFGVICAGLIAEVGVRVANLFFPYFYCYDAARGWGLRPNTAGYYRREGAAYFSDSGVKLIFTRCACDEITAVRTKIATQTNFFIFDSPTV